MRNLNILRLCLISYNIKLLLRRRINEMTPILILYFVSILDSDVPRVLFYIEYISQLISVASH